MAHSSAFRRDMVWKHIEIGGSLDSTRTASTGIVRNRPVITMADSNCNLSGLPVVVVDDSQGTQAAAACQSMLHNTAMYMDDDPMCAIPRAWRRLVLWDIDWERFGTCSVMMSCRPYLPPKIIWRPLQDI